ncbi:c-type heme family protein [Tenacibaculum aestuariivivum]|uniref:c-type heme family protein n=1 Tax=Tenacibaculum aestuariivivum TaxID=2006131 RepID=UPI003AB5E1F9
MKKALFLILVITFFNCNNKKESKQSYTTIKSEKLVKADIHPGKKLLETKCFVCHNATTAHNERIAPPMIAIKAHYIKKNTKRENFITEFTNFVTNPTVEKVKMHGAVRKFGVMPSQAFVTDEVKQIAAYIYDYEILEPSWFKSHWEDKKGTPYINIGKKSLLQNSPKTKEAIGLNYVKETKKLLGKNLMGKIQQKGTIEALQFCNEQAYKLTDSMATKFNATIKRVSDKERNPNNIASIKELEIIKNYKKIVFEKQKITPVLINNTNQTQFYYPIITNSMCLQCHGKPNKHIQPNIMKSLAELYPNDKAVGYDINQVRGIWSITFKNKNNE